MRNLNEIKSEKLKETVLKYCDSAIKTGKSTLQQETEVINEEKAEDASEEKSKEASQDVTQDDILRAFEECKLENPKLTFMEFCKKVAMGEIVIGGEVIKNEK